MKGEKQQANFNAGRNDQIHSISDLTHERLPTFPSIKRTDSG